MLKHIAIHRSLSEANRAKMSSEELQEEIVLLEKKNEALEKEIDQIRKEENDTATDMETMEVCCFFKYISFKSKQFRT